MSDNLHLCMEGWAPGPKVECSLCHTFSTLTAERDALALQLQAAQDALAEAERAQMERDCAADCSHCEKGEAPIKMDDGWHHRRDDKSWWYCGANDIRAAFAALHPETPDAQP